CRVLRRRGRSQPCSRLVSPTCIPLDRHASPSREAPQEGRSIPGVRLSAPWPAPPLAEVRCPAGHPFTDRPVLGLEAGLSDKLSDDRHANPRTPADVGGHLGPGWTRSCPAERLANLASGRRGHVQHESAATAPTLGPRPLAPDRRLSRETHRPALNPARSA